MKLFIYPTILQKKAMESVKNKKKKNIIIHYQEFNGIKLTVFLPLINNQIRYSIEQTASEETPKLNYSVILCHSKGRSQQISEFLAEMTYFCSEIIKVINLDESSDINDSLAQLRKAKESDTPGMSVVLVSTAGLYLEFLEKADDTTSCYSIVLDKVDLL